MRTLLALAVSAALSASGFFAARWAMASPRFALREVRFRGLSHVSEAELLRRSGLRLGENLFRQDLARAARRIEADPWIASARLERRLPGVVQVVVTERKAAALVQLGALYLLDDEGRLFKRAAPGEGLGLPTFTGLKRDDWLKQRAASQLRLYTGLQLLDAWRASGLSPEQLVAVRFEEDKSLVATAREVEGAAPQEIRLGARGFAVKLRRLAEVRAALARRGERALRIDLDNQARPDWVAAQVETSR